MEYCAGALLSPPDDEDLIYESIANAPDGFYMIPFPDALDLRTTDIPARDQENRGTCVAHAAAALQQIQLKTAELSPEFIYRNRCNRPASGMFARNAMKILTKLGVCKESTYPYGSEGEPSTSAFEEALQHRISDYMRISTLDGLKRALLEHGPAIVILRCYSNKPRFWEAPEGCADLHALHAVLVVGYTETGFTLLNSWGADWNGNGCCELPYEEFHELLECWVSTTGPVI